MRGIVSGREILVSDIEPGDEVFFTNTTMHAPNALIGSGIVAAIAPDLAPELALVFLAGESGDRVPPLIRPNWIVDIREKPSAPLPKRRAEILEERLNPNRDFFFSHQAQRRCATCTHLEFVSRWEEQVFDLWTRLLPPGARTGALRKQVAEMVMHPWDQGISAAILYQLTGRLRWSIPNMEIPMEVQDAPHSIQHRVRGDGALIATCARCNRDVRIGVHSN
jgi:hypothetical protein